MTDYLPKGPIPSADRKLPPVQLFLWCLVTALMLLIMIGAYGQIGQSFGDQPAATQTVLILIAGGFGWGAVAALSGVSTSQEDAASLDEAKNLRQKLLDDIDRVGCSELLDRLNRGIEVYGAPGTVMRSELGQLTRTIAAEYLALPKELVPWTERAKTALAALEPYRRTEYSGPPSPYELDLVRDLLDERGEEKDLAKMAEFGNDAAKAVLGATQRRAEQGRRAQHGPRG